MLKKNLPFIFEFSRVLKIKIMTKIDKKIIWVTGASSGIGEALVYQLHQLGAKLILSARRANELERVKNACTQNSEVHLLTLDLSEAETLEEKCKQALTLMGPIDLIIHCGGISQRDKVMNTSLAVLLFSFIQKYLLNNYNFDSQKNILGLILQQYKTHLHFRLMLQFYFQLSHSQFQN